jgi:hypothetical protein
MIFPIRLTPICFICLVVVQFFSISEGAEKVKPDSVAVEVIGTKAKTDSTSRKKNEITDTVFYEAETIFYDNEAKILTLTGKSKVRYQKMQLISDTIIYTINDNLFTASGYPQLVESTDTTIGDYMVYNIKTRRGRVRYASTNLTDGSFNGRRIVKTEKNEIYVDEGDYTTCENIEDPHFFFYGKKIKLIPQDRIISKPVVLDIGNTPVAVLPFFMFPLDRNRKSGWLTPIWGGHPTSGGYVDNIGYYYGGNDYFDLLARGKVMDFKRYEIEAATQYKLKYKFDGNLRLRYSLDRDFLAGGNQWTADYSHNQTLTPDGLTRLAGTGRLSSSNKYFFYNTEDSVELVDQELNANMALSRTLEKINGSANLTWSRDHNLKTNIVSEDLPSVSFNLQQRPLIKAPDSLKPEDVPWYSKIYYGYNARGLVKHIDSTRVQGKEHFRPGASHSLAVSSPQKLFRFIDVSPSFNANQFIVYGYSDTFIRGIDTTYDTTTYKRIAPFSRDRSYPEYSYDSIFDTLSRDDYGNPDTIEVQRVRRKIEPQYNNYDKMAHVEDWNAGLSVGTTLYGLFPLKFLNLMGIRHTFKPSLSYSYNPKLDIDKKFYPGGIAPPGARKRQQVLSLNAGNTLEGKFLSKEKTEGDSKGKTVSLLSFNVGTGYDFEKKHRKWSDLSLSASSSIEKIGLNVGYNSAFWLYDQNDRLIIPTMRSMSLDFRTSALSAKGTLWDGNLNGLDSVRSDTTKGKSGNRMLEWSGSLSPSFTYSIDRAKPTDMFIPKKQFNLSGSASLNFTKAWSLRWSGSYNFEQNQWVNNSFDLTCDLECWEMRFNWRPEKLNPGYYFLINIKKIPEIKWEQRQNQ